MACIESDIHSGDLLIKTTTSDTGERPLVPCTDYWRSPSVWLDGGVDQATAKVGVPNTINVRVHNISANDIADVNVEAWVCDYTVGVGPSGGIPSAGGSLPMTGFIATIPANSQRTAVCSPAWTPLASDVATFNGHVCIAANCFSDGGDGASVIGEPLKICCDSHHAQRNIAIKAVGRSKAMRFRFQVANPDLDEERLFFIHVEEVRGRGAFGRAEREQVRSGPLRKLDLRKSRFRPLALHFEGDDIKPGQEVEMVLRPKEPRVLELVAEFNEREQIGNFHTFDIIERTDDGDVVGGARVLAVIAPDDLL